MGKKWMLEAVFFGAAICMASCVRVQMVQQLPYQTSTEPHALAQGLGPKSLALVSEPPAGLTLPALQSEKPLFAKWPSPLVKNGYLWIALDCLTREGSYDRLWIDSNDDGRLSDEAELVPFTSGSTWARFGPIQVRPVDGKAPIKCPMVFSFAGGRESPRLSVASVGWYEGTIVVDGKEKQCVLVDQNANGTFDDRSIDFENCDLIQIVDKPEASIWITGNFIQVDEKLYRLEVARDGTSISLASARAVNYGTVRVPNEITELVVGGENGLLEVKTKNGVARLPVGKYRVYQWVLERKDQTGDTWSAKGWSKGNPEVFEVSKGSTAKLSLGEPLLSSVDIRNPANNEDVIVYGLRGTSGELVQLNRNGVALRAPGIHIQNADGSYDRIFTYSYG